MDLYGEKQLTQNVAACNAPTFEILRSPLNSWTSKPWPTEEETLRLADALEQWSKRAMIRWLGDGDKSQRPITAAACLGSPVSMHSNAPWKKCQGSTQIRSNVYVNNHAPYLANIILRIRTRKFPVVGVARLEVAVETKALPPIRVAMPENQAWNQNTSEHLISSRDFLAFLDDISSYFINSQAWQLNDCVWPWNTLNWW